MKGVAKERVWTEEEMKIEKAPPSAIERVWGAPAESVQTAEESKIEQEIQVQQKSKLRKKFKLF